MSGENVYIYMTIMKYAGHDNDLISINNTICIFYINF